MNSSKIVELLDAIQDAESETELATLDETVQLIDADAPTEVVQALLRIFERFPEDDGFEVFWSIVQTLEDIEGSETYLIESVRHQPSEFGVLMLNRLLNSGFKIVGSQDIQELLYWVASESSAPLSIKNMAHDVLEDQKKKA